MCSNAEIEDCIRVERVNLYVLLSFLNKHFILCFLWWFRCIRKSLFADFYAIAIGMMPGAYSFLFFFSYVCTWVRAYECLENLI